jgi:pimeloyl-ACP methyl ester carboxylesterase
MRGGSRTWESATWVNRDRLSALTLVHHQHLRRHAPRHPHNGPEAGAGTRFAIYGHSQGGLVALFGASLAPTYTPELTLVAVGAVSAASDPGRILHQIWTSPLAGWILGPIFVSPWTRYYPNLDASAILTPAVPPTARQLSTDVVQLSPESYTSPAQIPAGSVLVVGDGASGRQIAHELAATHRVFLATGRPRRVSPERLLGKSIFWWMDKLGILRASRESRIGKYLMKADPFPGKGLALKQLRQQGVCVVGCLLHVDGKTVTFASEETAPVETVIWATGYQEPTDWITIPEAKDAQGHLLHQRGISPVPHLYVIGRSWQWTRGSALLTGVGDDALHLTKHLLHHLERGTASIDTTKDELAV